MCGIAGISGRGATDSEALQRMGLAMPHRGPDGSGLWQSEGVGLAFRRLAIIDLHERSNQPFHFEHLHMVFNGEIYNYLELRDELRDRGHQFVTEGDAEVLLHAWAEWGETALDRFNGMFAFAIWNTLSRRLTLAVDRFAEKPLYFHEAVGRLMFASDVRALRAADGSVGVPERATLDAFLSLGTMPSLPHTFFGDVRRLPPGHVGVWGGQRLAIRRWWQPAHVDVPSEPQEAAASLRDLLLDSVRLRLRSDVPVGTSLSGGVDSSTVVALCAELAPASNRHAFTATFPGYERDEWHFAAAVARASVGIEHHAVTPTADMMLEDLERLVAAQQEPFASTSVYAQWQVMRAAREAGVVVLLDGQGADELLAGYPGLRGWALRARGLRAALREAARDRRLAELTAAAYADRLRHGRIGAGYRLRNASPYASDHIAQFAAQTQEDLPDWIASGSPLRRKQMNEAFRTSLPDLCRFLDHNSMEFGVEVRLPFLDHRVAEFGLSAAADLLYRDGATKRVLRDAARGLVPDVVLDRADKVAYEPPQTQWLATEAARSRIAEVLLDPGSLVEVDRAEVSRDVAAGGWRDSGAVWRAFSAELWMQAWASRPSAQHQPEVSRPAG
jgi:asparagine synthase (glutamine-hydrolysing)